MGVPNFAAVPRLRVIVQAVAVGALPSPPPVRAKRAETVCRDEHAFTEWANAYCAEQNVEFYDFNLLRERFALLSDEDCYSTDPMHMSEKGARMFTEAFVRIIQAAADGQDVSSSFYQSYSEMQWDSPYMARFQAE